MAAIIDGNVVADASLAARLGEVLCEALYRDLAQQMPLVAMDEERYWRVEGSRNRNGATDGIAEFFLSIDKSDGRVTDVGEYLRCPESPSLTTTLNGEVGTEEPTTKSHSILLTSIARGGVVFSAALAAKIGELYCEAHYGDLQRQAPLTAADSETYWRIEGNWNRDRKMNGAGSFFILIDKYDGRITEIGE